LPIRSGAALYSFYTTGELKSEGSSITEGIGQGRITKTSKASRRSTFAYQIPMRSRALVFDLLEHEGLCLGGSSASTLPARSGWQRRSAPATPS
jgi:cysteine synthase A